MTPPHAAWLVVAVGPHASELAREAALHHVGELPEEHTVGSDVAVLARGASSGEQRLVWSHTPLPSDAADDPERSRRRDDAATVVRDPGGEVRIRTGVSGAQGLYVRDLGARGSVVASSPEPLYAAAPATPDWDAWADIIVSGGPLEGRTPARDVRRLGPDEELRLRPGGATESRSVRWPWLEAPATSSGDLDAVAVALDAAVERLAGRTHLQVLLSGGWDSRTLATLAIRHDAEAAAWTTSKDSGTAWEELVARQVARRLGLPHRLVTPDASRFAEDLEVYAPTVGFQAPLHAWIHPLADTLAATDGTVLDGLGGGVFFGGAFPPRWTIGDGVRRRFAWFSRYLDAAVDVLHPRIDRALRDRTRESFERVARPLVDHHEVESLTAYRTRTLPNVSLLPYGTLAAHVRSATPFLDHDVVLSSMAIAPSARADRRLYPALLRRWSPAVADLSTANEPTPAGRLRARRSSCRRTTDAARHILTRGSVAALLHPDLRRADQRIWQAHLHSTGGQHLLRSLWLLQLWLDRHAPSEDPVRGLLDLGASA